MIRWFADTEFTNLDVIGGDLLTAYLIIADDNQILHEQELSSNHICDKYWSIEAQKVHKITKFEARKFNDAKSVCSTLIELNDKFPCVEFWNHALDFSFYDRKIFMRSHAHVDYAVLEWHFRKHGNVYDWFKIARPDQRRSTITIAKELGFKKRSLDVLTKHYNIDLDHHDSKSDTKALFKLWQCLTKEKRSENIFLQN